MHMLNVILKRIKASSSKCTHGRDTHERKHETKNDELVFKVQNLIGLYTKTNAACLNNVGG